MKKLTKILFAIFFLPAIFVGQNIPKINFDYAQFKVDSTHNLLEIYFQYELESLLQQTKSNDKVDDQRIVFELKDSLNQQVIQSDTVFIPSTTIKPNTKNSAPSVALHKFVVTPGTYFLRITLLVGENSNIDLITEEQIAVSTFSTKQPVLSDIQLAYKIDSAEEESVFNKNTLQVIPNPNASFSSDIPLLNYYVELYNVKSKPLILSTFIVSQNMDVVYSKKKTIDTKEANLVDIGKINLLRFPSGVYTLQVILTDSASNYAFGSEKKFYLYNKLLTQEIPDKQSTSEQITSQFSILSEEECNYAFDVSKYLANDQELNQYESLTSVEAKQNFLQKFWDKRKGNSITPYAAYEEYLSRVNEANRKFKKLSGLGYKSDMGRVYLSYGNPDRIERFPNESNLKPYEIWFYDNIEGGVFFIFGDLMGFSEYELLHSTKRGEMYDDNWQRRISIQ